MKKKREPEKIKKNVNKRIIIDLTKKNIRLVVLFFTVFIIMGIISLIVPKIENLREFSKAPEFNCMIEYGQYKCINDKTVIPFFNPNSRAITKVKITIPTKDGFDIYNVKGKLAPNNFDTVSVNGCLENSVFKTSELMWCCSNDCFEVVMNNSSEEVKIFD